MCIRRRKRNKPYWEPEGFTVSFEIEGQHNSGLGKEPYFVHATEEWRERRLQIALTTPEVIKTLQRKLYTKAKQIAARRKM